eukprot:3925674-Prymnesium_polylepis.1
MESMTKQKKVIASGARPSVPLLDMSHVTSSYMRGCAQGPAYDSSLSSSTSEAEPSMKARARKGTGPRAVGGWVDAGGEQGEPA